MVEDFNQSRELADQLRCLLEDSLKECTNIRKDLSKNSAPALALPEESYTPIMEFYKLKLGSYKRSTQEWTTEELRVARPQYRAPEELEESLAGLIGVNRSLKSSVEQMSSSKKLRGRNTSIYFSFDAEKDDVIPE